MEIMQNKWLKQRSEIMAKYAESLPQSSDTIELKFDYPEYGWLPVHFIKNGQDMGFFEFSDVYDCFGPLREWLETIAIVGFEKASVVNIDCERWHGVLYYEPIWFYYNYGNWKGDYYPPSYGIFSVYDEAEDKFILDAFCETVPFVSRIYKNILDFAKSMKEKPEFIEDWVMHNWNHEWGKYKDEDPRMKEIFTSKVKSESIVKFLKFCNYPQQEK